MKHALDAKNLLCPLPVIRLGEMMARIKPGDKIQISATDPGVLADIPAWCKIWRHEILTTRDDGGTIIFVIQKNATCENQ